MQTTIQSDASTHHLRAIHRTFVGFVVVAKTIEQLWCVLELMLVVHCRDTTFKNSSLYTLPPSHPPLINTHAWTVLSPLDILDYSLFFLSLLPYLTTSSSIIVPYPAWNSGQGHIFGFDAGGATMLTFNSQF